MPDEISTSLDAMLTEIEDQVEGLREYSRYLQSNKSRFRNLDEMAFAGSGDSYSAALWAQEVSHGKSKAYDPFELGLTPSRAQNKHVFIISVTGRTRANLFLAGRLKGVAAKRIAVTRDPESELANTCDETILLQYRHGETMTSGTASYTASLLACAQILGQMPGEVRLEHNFHAGSINDRLREKSRSIPALRELVLRQQFEPRKLVSRDGLVLFVGSGIDYPLAYYAALKFNEVLGLKAIPSYPEPIGHSLLFSLSPEKDRIVILDPKSNRRLRETGQTLTEAGLTIYDVDVAPQNPLSRTMELAFDLQILTYNLARDQGMKECAFVSDKSWLEISNRLIY